MQHVIAALIKAKTPSHSFALGAGLAAINPAGAPLSYEQLRLLLGFSRSRLIEACQDLEQRNLLTYPTGVGIFRRERQLTSEGSAQGPRTPYCWSVVVPPGAPSVHPHYQGWHKDVRSLALNAGLTQHARLVGIVAACVADENGIVDPKRLNEIAQACGLTRRTINRHLTDAIRSTKNDQYTQAVAAGQDVFTDTLLAFDTNVIDFIDLGSNPAYTAKPGTVTAQLHGQPVVFKKSAQAEYMDLGLETIQVNPDREISARIERLTWRPMGQPMPPIGEDGKLINPYADAVAAEKAAGLTKDETEAYAPGEFEEHVKQLTNIQKRRNEDLREEVEADLVEVHQPDLTPASDFDDVRQQLSDGLDEMAGLGFIDPITDWMTADDQEGTMPGNGHDKLHRYITEPRIAYVRALEACGGDDPIARLATKQALEWMVTRARNNVITDNPGAMLSKTAVNNVQVIKDRTKSVKQRQEDMAARRAADREQNQ